MNLITIKLPEDNLNIINELYIVECYYDDNSFQTIYIDYNTFHNINSKEIIYKHEFYDEILKNKSMSLYKFYIKGNYNDIYLCKLLYRIDSKTILLLVPDVELFSDIYNIIVEKNKEIIYKMPFKIISKKNIEFSIIEEEQNDFIKLNIKSKYQYPTLKDFNIEINNFKYNPKDIIYIKKYRENDTIKINYILKDCAINQNTFENQFIYHFKSKKNIIEDVKYHYNFIKDCLYLKLFTSNSIKTNFKISIGNDIFYTNNTEFIINNFSKYDNNSDIINMNIYYSYNFDFDQKYNLKVDNYIKLNKIKKFTPMIDYSRCLNVHNKIGKLIWTSPNVNYYSKLKIEVLHIKSFIDEYMEIWNKDYILDKDISEFDKKYENYNEEIEYDFPRNGIIFTKTPNESLLSYDGTNNGFLEFDNVNAYDLDLWFCAHNHKYKITVEIYDYWLNKIGENSVEFGLYESNIGEVNDNWLWFDRNQYIQFGETGTVGEFYKINNPKPIDVMRSYFNKYKTYNGKALYNQLNIDNENNSLYYYMHNNTDNNFNIKYMRYYNFYEFEYSLYNENSEEPVLKVIHEPKGNDYEDNIINIDRNLFKEGKNKLEIRTFNSEGIASNAKEYNFYVSNNKPITPYVVINPDDYYLKDEKIIINKKYFQIIITNNDQSNKYAGWQFKEVHFFFRKKGALYNEYPDYVVLASKDDGSIVLNNNTSIENGEYECKVIAYDYNGNSSDSYEFSFELISEIKIEPESLFTNKVDSKFLWRIKKSQDSEGFYYFLKYSADGINFENTEPIKVESRYYLNDKTTEQYYNLSINWIKDEDKSDEENIVYKEGLYILSVYEYNLKHLGGMKEYIFDSHVVDVSKVADASFPIYAKRSRTNEVINLKEYNEYSYTSDINEIEFETIHNIEIFDNPDTELIEGQRYAIELISPDKNKYYSDLPLPTEIGMYKFTKILDKCNIIDPIEGVWELRFITIDKFGNSNAYKGYYTYYIVYIKRNPKITILNPNTSNGSNIFGLNSKSISYIVNTSEIYSDILNYEEHKEKFVINKFKLIMNYNPFGSSYELNINSENNIIQVLNSLTEEDKINHLRDGKYSISVCCYDRLNRESSYIDRIFYIDTTINGELLFINNNIFNSRVIDLVAISSGEISTVYYTLDENNNDINTWNKLQVGDIQYNNENLYGIIISNLTFDSDGQKIIKYILEEESGNRSQQKIYYFSIDTEIKLLPIFDYSNKIYYTKADQNLNFSWNLTNEDVNHFYYKLDKIIIEDNGNIKVVESYMPSENGELLPVGPEKNDYVDIGNNRNLTIPLNENIWLITGYYMLTIKSFNIYNTFTSNNFKFNINIDTPIDLGYEMINNKITLDNNIISWTHISEANYYEISYDCFQWIRVIDNKFILNPDKVIKDNNGKTYIYMRWRSRSGIYSAVNKVEIYLNLIKLKEPKVYFYENNIITENNKKIEWRVEIYDLPKSKYLYYSFDNIKWNVKLINSSLERIINDELEYPLKDCRYNIFVRTTDGNPLEDKYINKSEIAYSYVDVFAENIPKPIFNGISNGQTFNIPIRLIIENKMPNVQYFIYVNNVQVLEGYEIASYNLERYNISVKAKKNGLEKIYNILDETDNFYIFSRVPEKYNIFIGDQKVICYVDSENESIIINSMPNKRNVEVILYKEKNSFSQWHILKIGDRLTLNKEWEFKISTFEII